MKKILNRAIVYILNSLLDRSSTMNKNEIRFLQITAKACRNNDLPGFVKLCAAYYPKDDSYAIELIKRSGNMEILEFVMYYRIKYGRPNYRSQLPNIKYQLPYIKHQSPISGDSLYFALRDQDVRRVKWCCDHKAPLDFARWEKHCEITTQLIDTMVRSNREIYDIVQGTYDITNRASDYFYNNWQNHLRSMNGGNECAGA